jgi:hypothetical protein
MPVEWPLCESVVDSRLTLRSAFWLLAFLSVPHVELGVATSLHNTSSAVCARTPDQTLLPSVIGPMTGMRPAWLVDGSGGRWAVDTSSGKITAAQGVKTLWVLSRTTQAVRIDGQRLDGPGTLKFRREQDGPITDVLVIENPARGSVIPAGATPEIMNAYSFIPSRVFYPTPGCWIYRVHVGGEQVQLVVDLK